MILSTGPTTEPSRSSSVQTALAIAMRWNTRQIPDEVIPSMSQFNGDYEFTERVNRLLIGKLRNLPVLTTSKLQQPIEKQVLGPIGRKRLRAEMLDTRKEILTQGLQDFGNLCNFPSAISKETQEMAILATTLISGLSCKETPVELAQAAIDMACALDIDGRISLMQFACPAISPSSVNDPGGEYYYVSSTAEKQLILNMNPSSQGRRLKDISGLLDLFEIPFEVTVVFGDDDEEVYIFPFLRPELVVFSRSDVFIQRLEDQSNDLQRRIDLIPWLRGRTKVRRWSTLNKMSMPSYVPEDTGTALNTRTNEIIENPTQTFSAADIEAEENNMRNLLATYYENVFGEIPPDVLTQIVAKKIAWYSFQGAKLELFFPFSVLLMNEQPAQLRKRMLRGITGESFSIISPYDLK